MGADPTVHRIGMRHGEKMFETLLSREERAKATDQGNYFRVPLDARSLDYSVYVEQGEEETVEVTDYDSNNTQRMDLEQTKALVAALPEMQRLLGTNR